MTNITQKIDGLSAKKQRDNTSTGKTRQKQNQPLRCHSRLVEYADEVYRGVENDPDWRGSGFLDYAEDKIQVIAAEYGISGMSAVFLCFFLEQYADENITESDIALWLHTGKLSLIRYQKEIEELRKKHLVRRRRDDEGVHYSLNPGVLKALQDGEKYEPFTAKNLPPEDFFEEIHSLFSHREKGYLSYREFIKDLRALIRQNKNVQFSKAISAFALDDEDLMIMAYFCGASVASDGNPKMYISPLWEYAEKRSAFVQTKRAFYDGKHNLLSLGLFERLPDDENEDPVDDEPMFRLSEKARETLLSDIPALYKPKSRNAGADDIIQSASIKAHELFYNETEAARIQHIESALNEDNYQAIQKRLREKGMGVGITCFFSGSPGTGKTETALQLARKTSRDILKVDLSGIKDSYVGQSEKNIKAVFDRYRELLKKSKITPILLFNEADGIFSRRIRIAEDTANPTVAQMVNTMQNIILDELDNFEGILIATTNLTGNMDGAFERRFLYKVEFKKPCARARAAIWKSLMPELHITTVETLSGKFDLSGGQIQNVARKSAVNYALSGVASDLAGLEALCREERPLAPAEKTVGFVA
jgi:hypothetical protein